MELHIIDMKAFAKAINEANSINITEAKEDMFAYWLSVITEKEIVNKDIIENARKKKEVIQMAITAVAMQSQDKMIRQAYQRRQDEIYFHKAEIAGYLQMTDEYKQRIEQAEAENEMLRKRLAEFEAEDQAIKPWQVY